MTRKLGLEAQVCPEDTEKLEQEQENGSRGEHCIDMETYERGVYAAQDLRLSDHEPKASNLSSDPPKAGTGAGTGTGTGLMDSSQNGVSLSPERASTSKDEDEADECVIAVISLPVAAAAAASSKDEEQAPRLRPESDTILRCSSSFSTDSLAECCRICQQHADELVIELGCHCRGELAKAHPACIQQWFGNKGSNKCEICQQTAENVPAPVSQSAPHFWVWRLGINRGSGILRRRAGARFHPLWAALLILIAGLLFDVLISIFLGASALPVNIIIGVLVVLGIGTAARLVVECWHERGLRRNIRRMETNLVHLQNDGMLGSHGATIIQGQSHFVLQPSGLIRPLR